MEPRAEKLSRPGVEALDEILGQPFDVLDQGMIRVVDYMGDDAAIVQAARVSYGSGTKKISNDRGLIRYLLRHRHTTPFEMCELKLHVRVPMDAWRQWIRHRTACLAEGTEIYFDLPGGVKRRGNQLYKLKIEDIWQRFQPTRNTQRPDKQRDPYFKRDRVKGMRLRHLDEATGTIKHTRIVDVYRNGSKPIFRYTLADGKAIEATADHKFLFADGWSTFKHQVNLEERDGRAIWDGKRVHLNVNGAVAERPALYMDKTWLDEQYNVEKLRIQELKYVERLGGTTLKTEWKKRPRIAWNKLVTPRLVEVVDIEYVSIKETYDLEVEGPSHNFIANGIVTHNSVNEYSTRYSVAIDAAQQTGTDQWRTQAVDNKQGSGDFLDPATGEPLTASEVELQSKARQVYDQRVEAGVAREQARKDLPLCTYTEAYWKIDLHNLLHFLSLRMDSHAQKEIRDYATIIGEQIVARWVPLTWEAFQDYRFGAMGLSRLEREVIAAVGANDTEQALALASEAGWLNPSKKGGLVNNRERIELETKLREFNLPVPWED